MFSRSPHAYRALISHHTCPFKYAKFSLSAPIKTKNTIKVSLTQESEKTNSTVKSVSQQQHLSATSSRKDIQANLYGDYLNRSDIKDITSMPIRSKINNENFKKRTPRPKENNLPHTASKPSENIEIIHELPGDEKEDVLFNTLFGARFIELNRPAKLNSLNCSMIRKIIPRLQEWAKSDMANVIIIKGCGPRAFCAGGDVVELVKQNLSGKEGIQKSADYFALEYKLDHLIATYSKPYVAFMDGHTMGGGVGLSIHAPIRIATEKTVFAMPETKIGFFPDIGASFFLPRLNGSIGTYLALTGDRLEGVNVFYSGLATHYIHSSSLYPLELRLSELRFKDYDSLDQRLNLINSTIEEYVTGLPHDQQITISGEKRKMIDRCFDKGSIVSILATLEAEEGVSKSWSEEILETLRSRSPTSLCVTLRLMQLGKKWSISQAFKREHMLATRFMRKSDFNEGVDALLIKKNASPKWDPPSYKDIELENAILEPYFETKGIKPLNLLNEVDFLQYPHSNYGLPSEDEIKMVIKKSSALPNQIIDYFLKISKGKQGVKEIVEEVIERKTIRPKKDGPILWNDSDD